MFNHGRTEWDTDLIFKKPFTLSDKVEFMIGLGPQWTFSPEGTKMGAELAADFIFWPTPDRKYGWFLEPTYSYSFSSGHEKSLHTNRSTTNRMPVTAVLIGRPSMFRPETKVTNGSSRRADRTTVSQ
jgi:hypothetical protein